MNDERRTHCRGRRRRVIGSEGAWDWDCPWLRCPVLWPDEPCPFRLADDDRSLPPLGMDQVVTDDAEDA